MSNARLDVMLPMSDGGKEERATLAAMAEGRTEEKERRHTS